MGEKPLYYGVCPRGLVFASELACFKDFFKNSWEIDRDSLSLFFRHNYIPAPYSIFKNVWKLQPGHYLKIRLDDIHADAHEPFVSEPFWDVSRLAEDCFGNQLSDPIETCKFTLDSLLKKAVKRQMVADVPLGAFLSGGVDSSLIVGIMQSLSTRPVKTFTIGFHEAEFNEATYAKEVARHIGTDHNELYVTSQMAQNVVPDICKFFSEPFADSSQIPTVLLSKFARNGVRVALSGEAGDELFGGYSRYFICEKLQKFAGICDRRIQGFISQMLQNAGRLAKYLARHSGFPAGKVTDKLLRTADLFLTRNSDQFYKSFVSHSQTPSSLVLLSSGEPETKLDLIEQMHFLPSRYEQMMFLDFISYLPDDILVKADRSSMGVSLETRAPFLDPEIVEFSFRVPIRYKIQKGRGKMLLRQLLDTYVPRALIERPKKGFAVPLAEWLKGDLQEWAAELLTESRLNAEGYVDVRQVRNMWYEHQTGQRSCEYQLWNILMFQSWLDEWKKQ